MYFACKHTNYTFYTMCIPFNPFSCCTQTANRIEVANNLSKIAIHHTQSRLLCAAMSDNARVALFIGCRVSNIYRVAQRESCASAICQRHYIVLVAVCSFDCKSNGVWLVANVAQNTDTLRRRRRDNHTKNIVCL